MKKCSQCGREYDDTMAFCLDDGGELLYGPASTEECDDPRDKSLLKRLSLPE